MSYRQLASWERYIVIGFGPHFPQGDTWGGDSFLFRIFFLHLSTWRRGSSYVCAFVVWHSHGLNGGAASSFVSGAAEFFEGRVDFLAPIVLGSAGSRSRSLTKVVAHPPWPSGITNSSQMFLRPPHLLLGIAFASFSLLDLSQLSSLLVSCACTIKESFLKCSREVPHNMECLQTICIIL